MGESKKGGELSGIKRALGRQEVVGSMRLGSKSRGKAVIGEGKKRLLNSVELKEQETSKKWRDRCTLGQRAGGKQ